MLKNFQHYDVLLMCIASSQVCYAAMFQRNYMIPAYRKYMDYQCGIPREYIQSYTDIVQYNQIIKSETYNQLNHTRKLNNLKKISDQYLSTTHHLSKKNKIEICNEILHPNQSFLVATYTSWKNSIKKSILLYLPVYLLPLILFKYKFLWNNFSVSLIRAIYGISRSTLFLTLYTSLGWSSMYFLRSFLYSTPSKFNVCIGGFIAGLSVFIDKKPRRLELALYVFSQAIQIFYNRWKKVILLPSIKYGEILLFSCSSAILMHSYINQPKYLRSSYFLLFKNLFGSGGKLEGFPELQKQNSLKYIIQ